MRNRLASKVLLCVLAGTICLSGIHETIGAESYIKKFALAPKSHTEDASLMLIIKKIVASPNKSPTQLKEKFNLILAMPDSENAFLDLFGMLTRDISRAEKISMVLSFPSIAISKLFRSFFDSFEEELIFDRFFREVLSMVIRMHNLGWVLDRLQKMRQTLANFFRNIAAGFRPPWVRHQIQAQNAMRALALILQDTSPQSVQLKQILGNVAKKDGPIGAEAGALLAGAYQHDPNGQEEMTANAYLARQGRAMARIRPYQQLANHFGYKPWASLWSRVFQMRMFVGYRMPADVEPMVFEHGMRVLQKEFGKRLLEYWPGLATLGQAAGEGAGVLFIKIIPLLRRLCGKNFRDYWPTLVEVGYPAGESVVDLLGTDLPSLGQQLQNHANFNAVVSFLRKLLEISREGYQSVFRDLPDSHRRLLMRDPIAQAEIITFAKLSRWDFSANLKDLREIPPQSFREELQQRIELLETFGITSVFPPLLAYFRSASTDQRAFWSQNKATGSFELSLEAVESVSEESKKKEMVALLNMILHRLPIFRINASNVPVLLELLRYAKDENLKGEGLKLLNNILANDRSIQLTESEVDIIFEILGSTINSAIIAEGLVALGNILHGENRLILKERQWDILISFASHKDGNLRDPAILALSAVMAKDDKAITHVIQKMGDVSMNGNPGWLEATLGMAIDRHRDMRFTAEHIRELLDLGDIKNDAMKTGISESREKLFRIVEYLYFRAPESFTEEIMAQVQSSFADIPQSKYLKFYASMYDPRRREELTAEDFPHHREVQAILGKGKKKVLIVHNIEDGQGDELIRIGTIAQALLDLNPALEIELFTNREYLCDNDRVKVHGIKTNKIPDTTVFDMIIVHGGYKPYIPEPQLQGKSPIFVDMSRVGVGLAAERGIFIRDQRTALMGPDDNIYTPFFKLCAELGLPFRWGTHRRPADSLFTGKVYDSADTWWEMNVMTRNSSARPVAFFNGFGGESESKGYAHAQHDRFVADIQDVIEKGFFVILFPNGREPYGTAKVATTIWERLPETCKEQCVIAPEPKGDVRLTKYLVDKSDMVITCEGGMMHLAYNMGKPFVLLQMPGAGNINWWLCRAISYQKVNFMKPWLNVGELAAQAAEQAGIVLQKHWPKEPVVHMERFEIAA